MMTPEQRNTKLHVLFSRAKLLGSVSVGAIGLGFGIVQCAGTRGFDMAIASVVTPTQLHDHAAAEDNRFFRDSLNTALALERIRARIESTDSLVHCIRATQLRRRECE